MKLLSERKKKRNSDFITLILAGLRTTDSIVAIIIQENTFNFKATFCVHLLIYTSLLINLIFPHISHFYSFYFN